MSQFDQENILVLALVQAMIGAVSQNFRRVSVGWTGDRVRLQFVLLQEADEDVEEISDIEFTFEALLGSSTEVVTDVLVTTQDLSEVAPSGRVVFARRET